MKFNWVTKYIVFMCAMFQIIGASCLIGGYLTNFNWAAFLMPVWFAAGWIAGDVFYQRIKNKRSRKNNGK